MSSPVMPNKNKKYPRVPKHMQTDRSRCNFCPHSERTAEGNVPLNSDKCDMNFNSIEDFYAVTEFDNSNKCAECGIGSRDFLFGSLVAFAREARLPMALVEKVTCPTYIAAIKNDETFKNEYAYLVFDEDVYHVINLSSKKADCITLGQCCINRRMDGNEWLDDWCMHHDFKHAIEAIEAIENDRDDFFNAHPDVENMRFEYHAYKCDISNLHEVLVPIYAGYGKKGIKRSEMGFMGILIIGQLAINMATGSTPSNEVEFPMQLDFINKESIPVDDEKKVQIEKLRHEALRNAKDEDRIFDTIEAAMDNYSDKIQKYLRDNKYRAIMRTTDFFHLYQSRLMQGYLMSKIKMSDSNDGNVLKECVMGLFRQICKDFYIKRMFIFFPDLNMKTADIAKEAHGESVSQEIDLADYLSVSIDLSKLPPPSTEFRVDVGLLEKNNCLIAKNVNFEKVSLSNERVNEGYYDFYAATSEKAIAETFFAVFFEWENPPPKYDEVKDRHSELFSVLTAVCSADIMACIAGLRSERLRLFAEGTRHDLAQRLQKLDYQNKTFRKNVNDFSNTYALSRDKTNRFVEQCNIYLGENFNLHDALTFLNDAIDHAGLDYEFKPDWFFPYTDVLVHFAQNFNASWHPLNKGHRLMVYPHVARAELFADRRMFERIMMNLLDNALKHSPMGTNVYLRQGYDDMYCYFDIINFAVNGIPENMVSNLFKDKTRGEEAKKRKSNRGEGLGLYISQDFAKRHKGEIVVKSGIVPTDIGNGYTSDCISDINFTYFYELKNMVESFEKKSNSVPNTSNNRDLTSLKHRQNEVKELFEASKNATEKLKIQHEGELYEFAKLFGKQNLFEFVMSGRKEKDYETEVYLRRIRREQKKPLYMVTFTLKLPLQKMD